MRPISSARRLRMSARVASGIISQRQYSHGLAQSPRFGRLSRLARPPKERSEASVKRKQPGAKARRAAPKARASDQKARSSRRGAAPVRPLLRRDRRAMALASAEAKALEGPPPERRERRALSHVGGRTELSGEDRDLAAALAAALDVPREDASTQAHVHGFHSYAARLHPLTARRLIERMSAPGQTVFDAFMGSGTVLVEARLLERRAIGTDLNPLSVDLAHLKTRGTTPLDRRQLPEASLRPADHPDECARLTG